MKKLTGLVIILAVLILGGYYGMGVLTEKAIRNNLEVINQSNGLLAQIEEYNRGWFDSSAKIKWRLNIPERLVMGNDGKTQVVPAQTYQMETPFKIYHGPFIYADNKLRFGLGYAKSLIVLPQEYNKEFDEKFAQESIKPQLDLNIFINYLNKSKVELSVPSFKLISKDKVTQFEWSGLESKNQLSSDYNKAVGDLVIAGLTLTKENTKAILGKVTTDYNLHKTPAGLYLGNANGSLSTLDLMENDKKIFGVSDFDLSSDSDINQDLFSTHLTVKVNSVLVNNLNYGPADLEVSVRNLDANVLADINNQASAMQNGTDAERQKAMISLLPQLPKLFNKGAEFEISKLNLKLPEGDVEAHLLITLPKEANSNPFELMQKTQGNATLRIPQSVTKQLVQKSVAQQFAKQPEMQQILLEQLQKTNQAATGAQPAASQPALTQEQLITMQTDKQISAMQQNGLIIAKGSDYFIEMKLEQGKLVINGKPFDPAMLKM